MLGSSSYFGGASWMVETNGFMEKREVGVARYEYVGKDYLENRKLERSAGWILLWALGVGAGALVTISPRLRR